MPSARDGHEPVAVITGVSGFVGGRLAHALIEKGWRVIGIHRATSRLHDVPSLGIDLREADLLDPAALLRAVPDNADAVFHVAGDTGTWRRRNAEQWRLNVEATEKMLAAARIRRAGRFVHTSTVSAWGRHGKAIDERTTSNAEKSWIGYERSKWAAQQRVLNAAADGLDAVVVAPGAIIGPGDRNGWSKMFVQVAEGRLQGVPPGTATFNAIGDVVATHIAAFERGRKGECYLVPGETVTFARLIELISDALNVRVKNKPMPRLAMTAAAQLFALMAALTGREPPLTPEVAALLSSSIVIDSTKTETELGISSSPLPEAVGATCRWLASVGLLEGANHDK